MTKFGVVFLVLASCIVSSTANAEIGWKTLFNGENLDGWVTHGDQDWSVKDGKIVSKAKAPKVGWLYTDKKYDNFVLRLRVRWQNGDSGIQFRTYLHSDGMATGYQANLDANRKFATGSLLYETNGKDPFKRRIIHTLQHRFLPERTYTYLMSVELPKKYTGERKIVPEADKLFNEAQLLTRGDDDIEWIDYPKQRQAMKKFKRLIQMYPQSPRVADAAYYVGRIYGRYFKEPYLAVRWYEVALDWDPYIAHPIYFELATECDFGLKDKDAAIKYYEESIAKEAAYKDNYKFARDRLEELRKK